MDRLLAHKTSNPANIPYGRQTIEADDIVAVAEALQSSWLTTGPRVGDFEQAFARQVGAAEAVAVSSGTAALHAAMFALGIGPGDEVLVPAMTFAATANCVVYQGGTPVFCDVHPETLLIDTHDMASKITSRTKAVIAVDYCGQPCDYDSIHRIAQEHDLAVVSDACHSLGGKYHGRNVGTLANLNVFSFHPVKHITTGEGGLITTSNAEWVSRMRMFRNHGITSEARERARSGIATYEMIELGYNYRLTDFQSALGMSQLKKLPVWIERRREIAKCYDDAFARSELLTKLAVSDDVYHAYHLYVVQLATERLQTNRDHVLAELRRAGIGANIHYIPVHLHTFYRERFTTGPGMCPVAESAFERMISLPIFPLMTAEEVETVISTVTNVLEAYAA